MSYQKPTIEVEAAVRTIDGRSTARFLAVGAVGRGPRTESHGARGRPEAPGSWRTESEGEDGGASWHGSPPRASGFVAQRRGSESPASRGCPWRACPLDLGGGGRRREVVRRGRGRRPVTRSGGGHDGSEPPAACGRRGGRGRSSGGADGSRGWGEAAHRDGAEARTGSGDR